MIAAVKRFRDISLPEYRYAYVIIIFSQRRAGLGA